MPIYDNPNCLKLPSLMYNTFIVDPPLYSNNKLIPKYKKTEETKTFFKENNDMSLMDAITEASEDKFSDKILKLIELGVMVTFSPEKDNLTRLKLISDKYKINIDTIINKEEMKSLSFLDSTISYIEQDEYIQNSQKQIDQWIMDLASQEVKNSTFYFEFKRSSATDAAVAKLEKNGWNVVLPLEVQENIPETIEDSHKGEIYNPITGKWSFGLI